MRVENMLNQIAYRKQTAIGQLPRCWLGGVDIRLGSKFEVMLSTNTKQSTFSRAERKMLNLAAKESRLQSFYFQETGLGVDI
jgi:hypothetical protein